MIDLTKYDLKLAKELELLYKFFEEAVEPYKDTITFIEEEEGQICIKPIKLNPHFFFKIKGFHFNTDESHLVCTIQCLPGSKGRLEIYTANKWRKNIKYEWEYWLNTILEYNRLADYQQQLSTKYLPQKTVNESIEDFPKESWLSIVLKKIKGK